MNPSWVGELDAARAAGVPGVILAFNTADRVYLADEGLSPCSLPYALARRFSSQGYWAGYFSSASRFQTLTGEGEASSQGRSATGGNPFRAVPDVRDPSLVLASLTRSLREVTPPVLLIIDYADHLTPDSGGSPASLREDQVRTLEIIHGWGQDQNIRATDNFIVLISYENCFSPVLRDSGGYRILRVDLPSLQERRQFLDQAETRNWPAPGVIGDTATVARQTNGLRLRDIEELLRQVHVSGEQVSRRQVRETKRRVISQIGRDTVSVVEPQEGFASVAGCAHAKDYFELIRRPWREGAASVPQAILLAGVPGCGKSHLVKALAKELEVPLLAMRNVREKWVGASERNLERVLWIAENLSPCILWTDEIDQAVGQRSTGSSGDSGTSERLLARIFEFFGSMEHRGRILWVATTNRPDILDPALLDRFQITIPFIHPSAADRAELIPILANQIDRALAPGLPIQEVAQRPALDALTIRSLQEILVHAGLQADRFSPTLGAEVEQPHLEQALAEYKPVYNPTEHEYIALTALEMTPFTSLLPWHASGFAKEQGWPRYLEGMVDPETGDLLLEDLRQRLGDLRERRTWERHTR